jgi:hypothetical protein
MVYSIGLQDRLFKVVEGDCTTITNVVGVDVSIVLDGMVMVMVMVVVVVMVTVVVVVVVISS